MWPAQSLDFINIHPLKYIHVWPVVAPYDLSDLESCGNVFVNVVGSRQTCSLENVTVGLLLGTVARNYAGWDSLNSVK